MTIGEALAAFKRYNAIMSEEEQIAALSALDGRIKIEIIDTHEGGENVSFTPYTVDTPRKMVLIVPHPYDVLYINFLVANEALKREEHERYNNALYVFNEAYADFRKAYNRTHMPRAVYVAYN